jgi:hypothetical protein
MAEGRLKAFFSPPKSKYTDDDFERIQLLLEFIPGLLKYRNMPRLYILLCIMGCSDDLDHFLEDSLSDHLFPFTFERLPAKLRPAWKSDFLSRQAIVCDNSDAVQLIGKQKHMNFTESPRCFISKGRFAPPGDLSEVDDVLCVLDVQRYARKLYYRPRWSHHDRSVSEHFKNEVENMKKIAHHHCVKLVRLSMRCRYIHIYLSSVLTSLIIY